MAEVDEIEIRNGTHKDDQYSGASEDTNIGTPESNNGEQPDNQDVKGVSMKTDLPKNLSPNQDSENKDEDAKVTGKTACRKFSLSNRENNVDGDKPARKRKWRTVSNSSQSVKKTSLNISTDSLKELIPDIKTLSTLDSVLELDEEEAQISDNDNLKEEFHEINKRDVKIRRTVTQVVREIEHQDSTQDGMESMDLDQGEILEKSQHIPVLKKSRNLQPATLIEEPLVVRGIPSPARNPISRIIHIRNLVRPFTLAQLKNLLSRTGTLVSGFWIDKIKSHCYATYESDDQAIATRQALHGVKWPPPNPKYLKVDYADQEELDFHKNLIEKDLKPAELIKKERRDNDHGGREIRTNFETRMPEREWDRDKVLHQSSSADKTHTRSRTRSGSQEKWKPEKTKERRDKKEREKKDDEAPAKLLDDLFNKTKATPCIYWLALTEEQMKIKLEERKQKQLEREKRRQLLEKEQKRRIEAERKERREADERRQQRRERNDRSKVTGRSPTRRSRSRNRNSRSRRR